MTRPAMKITGSFISQARKNLKLLSGVASILNLNKMLGRASSRSSWKEKRFWAGAAVTAATELRNSITIASSFSLAALLSL